MSELGVNVAAMKSAAPAFAVVAADLDEARVGRLEEDATDPGHALGRSRWRLLSLAGRLVLDADALTILSQRPDLFAAPPIPVTRRVPS